MNHATFIYLFVAILSFAMSCTNSTATPAPEVPNQAQRFAEEKSAILKVINDETKAAFNRDYPAWKAQWIQEVYVTKTYMNFADTSMTETLGWKEIDDFVRTYIEEHPEPAPLPKLVADIDVRLYGNGAWVNYEQNDAERGLKRETRLMEKQDGRWKIAGMQTIIYGFEENTN